MVSKEKQAVKNLNLENVNQDNEKRMKTDKMLIQESLQPSPWELWTLYLEEIVGGSVLGSLSCSTDGTWLRGMESHSKDERREYGNDWEGSEEADGISEGKGFES